MAGSYLPTREPELRDWVVNFSNLITAAPATYGLVAADATAPAWTMSNVRLFVAK